MRNTVAIMQRELLSLFFSPIAYIVVAGFLLLTGVIVLVTGTFAPGQPATLREVFRFTPYVLSIIIPAIAMRTIAEEYRSGTIETLVTASVTEVQLVLGKFLAALFFYVVMLAGTLIYLVLMMIFGRPDIGASLSSYLGLLLLGMAFMSFGVFASSLTRDQVVAWVIGTVPLMLFVWFAAYFVQTVEGTLRLILQCISVNQHLDQFNQGLITTEGVVFFLAVTVVFLFLSIKVLESRRWR